MTEEQNKLAEELEKLMEEPSDRATARWVNINWPQLWNALRVEREPATEAVLEALEEAARRYPDNPAVAFLFGAIGPTGNAKAAHEAALKGKGASQGADGPFVVATTAELAKEFGASDNEAQAIQAKVERLAGANPIAAPQAGQSSLGRAFDNEGHAAGPAVAAPEPSGEFVSLAKVKAIINKERIWDAARGQTRRTWAADEILGELDALATFSDEQKG